MTTLPLISQITKDHAATWPPTHLSLVLAATTILVITLVRHLHSDWKLFKSLGPGGTPMTIRGYCRVKTLSFVALRDPYEEYPPSEFPDDTPGYISTVEKRNRPRPVTRGIAPHRQMTQRANAEQYQVLAEEISRMGTTNERLELGTSCFEKHGTGLFSHSPVKRTCRGEVVHAHPSDGSMHATLHPRDANIVLQAGWGERHPLARGGWFEKFVPGGFMMIYAPLDAEEMEVVREIIEAAVWFVSGKKGVPERTVDEENRRDSGYVSGAEPK